MDGRALDVPWTLTPVSREESSEIQRILPDTFELDVQVGLLLARMKCGCVGGREWTQAGRRMRRVGGKEGLGLPTPGGASAGKGSGRGTVRVSPAHGAGFILVPLLSLHTSARSSWG